MKQQLYYKLELVDLKTGKTIKRWRKRLCRSLLINYIGLLYMQRSSTVQTITDIGGTDITISRQPENLNVDAGVGVDTHGVVIGKGTTPVAIGDTKLETQIAHGTGAGQLEHTATIVQTPSLGGSSSFFRFFRTFNNNSGATIAIKEIGVYCLGGNSGSYDFCIVRDVISSVDVTDAQGLTVTYELKVAV